MREATPGIESMVQDLLRRFPADPSLELGFDRCIFRVRSNSAELLQRLAGYYDGYHSPMSGDPILTIHVLEAPPPDLKIILVPEPPEAGKKKIKHEYRDLSDGRVVRKRETGMQFVFGPRIHLAVGPCLAHLAQVINFINTRYMERLLHQGAVLCHASGAAFEGAGLTIAGPSGTGKSTITLHLTARGAGFVSNDRVLINGSKEGAWMHGVPKYPRINPGTIMNNPSLRSLLSERDRALLAELSSESLWNLERKHDVRVADLFGRERVQLSARLRALAVISWRRESLPLRVEAVDLCTQREALIPALKPPGLFFWPGAEDHCKNPRAQLDSLVPKLGGCRVVRIHGGGEFAPVVQACWELLTGTATAP